MYTIKLTSVTYTMYTYEQVAAKIHDEKDPACLSLKAGSSWVDLSFTLWLPCLDMEVAIASLSFPVSCSHCPHSTLVLSTLKVISEIYYLII